MKFYSQSKKKELDTADVPTPHLTNLKKKIERGEYVDATGEPLGVDEEKALLDAIDNELARRESETSTTEGYA